MDVVFIVVATIAEDSWGTIYLIPDSKGDVYRWGHVLNLLTWHWVTFSDFLSSLSLSLSPGRTGTHLRRTVTLIKPVVITKVGFKKIYKYSDAEMLHSISLKRSLHPPFLALWWHRHLAGGYLTISFERSYLGSKASKSCPLSLPVHHIQQPGQWPDTSRVWHLSLATRKGFSYTTLWQRKDLKHQKSTFCFLFSRGTKLQTEVIELIERKQNDSLCCYLCYYIAFMLRLSSLFLW